MKKILGWVVVLVIMAAGLWFAHLNPDHVVVNYWYWTVEWPLAATLLAYAFGGVLVGGLAVYVTSVIPMKARFASLQRHTRSIAQKKQITQSDD